MSCLISGATFTIDNPYDGFYIYTNDKSGCEHPRDYIYMPWGYSPFVNRATSTHGVHTFIYVMLSVAIVGQWVTV